MMWFFLRGFYAPYPTGTETKFVGEIAEVIDAGEVAYVCEEGEVVE